MLKNICVFCGSRSGSRPEYTQGARMLGAALARRDLALIYGGAKVGLMGTVADAAREAGGAVIGIIPQGLVRKEVAHHALDDLRIVGSMHERKAQMAELADAFIALPGGFGTFEEFFEVVTWAQIGLHRKPCALLNVAGYYDPLLALIDHAVAEDFAPPAHRRLIVTDTDVNRLLDTLSHYETPLVEKWIRREEN